MSTRIYRACDRCETLGMETPAEPRGPFMGRMVDLCNECYDEVAKALVALVEDRGVPADGSKPRRQYRRKAPQADEQVAPVVADPRAVTCPLCGVLCDTKDRFATHLRRDHDGLTTGVLFGTVCPVCGQDSGQIGAHANKAHVDLGVRRAVDAFEWARVHGDPHGLYAERIMPLLVA